MMKRIALLLLTLIVVVAGCSTTRGKTGSTIVVHPVGEGAAVTDGSLVYALPQTLFEIVITAERVVEIPGPYAAWASELVGLDGAITLERESWSLEGVTLHSLEEPDPSQFYIIEGTTLMHTNMLALRRSGLVLDINPGLYSHTLTVAGQPQTGGGHLLFPDRGLYEYSTTTTDTMYRVVEADTAYIRVPYLIQRRRGMSKAEEAREAAERLLELREGRHMILTGETNVFPQDGAALAEINRLEREYMALFSGKRQIERRHYRIWVTPDRTMAGKRSTILTFSEEKGVITDGSGDGVPVEMEIIPSGKTRELNLVVRPVTSQKELMLNDKIYYRVPDVAEVYVTIGERRLCSFRGLIYQYGNRVALPANFIIGR